MICWYCHWGWPKQIVDIYRRAVEAVDWEAMDYGPGHIVWADENFDNASIESCIADTATYRFDEPDVDVAVVVQALKDLLEVPEEIRCCVPEEYDEENPENYPPPAGMVMEHPRSIL